MDNLVTCEGCEQEVPPDIAWGPDGDGIYLCPPCAYSHLEGEIPEWQSIETAPKDGTEIDIWINPSTGGEGRRVANTWWCQHLLMWFAFHDMDNPPMLQGMLCPQPIKGIATHWMPLPDPPEEV
jgi:hypothetical protein